MKKLLGFMNLAALFAAVTFVSSCQKEDFQDTPQDAVEDDGTRAAYSSSAGNNISWQMNDKLAVFQFCKMGEITEVQRKEFTVDEAFIKTYGQADKDSYPVMKSCFTPVDNPAIISGKKRFMYQAFYPAKQASCNNDKRKVYFTLPMKQTISSNGSCDPNADLIVCEKTYAEAQKGIETHKKVGLHPFHRVSAIGRINIKGLGKNFKNITITSNSVLAGTYRIFYDNILANDILKLSGQKYIMNPAHKIAYNLSETIELSPNSFCPSNANDYAVCFSCLADENIKHNLTITVTTVDDQVFTRTYNGIVLSANTVTDIPFEIVTKTMMTYNVYGFDMYKNKETSAYIQGSSNDIYKDIAKVIEASKASIVGLNEVFNGNTHGNQPELLRKELVTAWDGKKDNSHRWAFSKALTRNNESYGNAIVYRYGRDGGEGGFTLSTTNKCYRPLTDNNGTKQTNAKGEIIYFSKAEEVRSVSYAVFSDCVFASVHLGLSSAGRKEQVKALTNKINEIFNTEDKPVFLCGDFNADYYPTTNEYYTKAGYVKDKQESIDKLMSADTWTRLTESEVSSHPSTNNRLDHFFVYNKGKWSGNVVVTSELVPDQFIDGKLKENSPQLGSKKATSLRRLSDHLPVIITVKWVK